MRYPFIRFLLVGIINTMVGLTCMYLFLHGLGFSYWAATFLGNTIGACVSFFLNRSFTFKSSHSITKSIFRFIAVILLCYFVSYYLGENIVALLLSQQHSISAGMKTDIAVLTSTILYTLLNYAGQKRFVFPKKMENK
ncbi:GtrA family protein [Bacillus benzoevorans]|uniref:Putative flippase GtrA n=1 Tax=Bacillus benzoevorans TaxID=1456 RepID=A0A7X0HPC6_9BACI|nr:GtrA family protein [Bacillus benzoevorans]MBB6444369.1 putative flippase GtrA [Bacillus benzoevorans]